MTLRIPMKFKSSEKKRMHLSIFFSLKQYFYTSMPWTKKEIAFSIFYIYCFLEIVGAFYGNYFLEGIPLWLSTMLWLSMIYYSLWIYVLLYFNEEDEIYIISNTTFEEGC